MRGPALASKVEAIEEDAYQPLASVCTNPLIHVNTHVNMNTYKHTHQTHIQVPGRGKGKIIINIILMLFRNVQTCFKMNSKGAGEMATWVKMPAA